MTAGLDPEMLRTLVREALADLLPEGPGVRLECGVAESPLGAPVAA